MIFDIKHIKIEDLENFLASEEFKAFDFLPISSLRAFSHAKNPNADSGDIALFLAYHEKQLIGYLGAIPDYLHSSNASKKIGWFSCMWVLPEYRRSGIALKLFNDAFDKYNGYVCITNYHPMSKVVLTKTGMLREAKVLTGIRAYLRFDTHNIVVRNRPEFRWLTPFLKLADSAANLIFDNYFKLFAPKLPSQFNFIPVPSIDEALGKFISNELSRAPFRRGIKEFNWILKYPWIQKSSCRGAEAAKYYFSVSSPDFRQWAVLIKDNRDQITGFAVLVQHRNTLKTPYLIVNNEMLPELFQYVYRLMQRQKIATLVTHHNEFSKELRKQRKSFIYQRTSQSGFLASQKIEQFSEGKFGEINEGDGDNVFT